MIIKGLAHIIPNTKRKGVPIPRLKTMVILHSETKVSVPVKELVSPKKWVISIANVTMVARYV